MISATHQQHQDRRYELHRQSRRYTLFLSALIGVLAGLMAVLFRLLVVFAETSRAQVSGALCVAHPVGGVLLVVAIGAIMGTLAVVLTSRYCPEASGSGIPHVKAILISARRMRPVPTIIVKMLGGLLALGAGMSLGREGPTVHLGAACASLYSQFAKLPGRTRRTLVAAGAGAGLAAAFNAPLAGFLFIMEELRRDMSHGTYGNALVTSVASVAVTRACLGYDSAFLLADSPPMPLSALPFVVLVGLAAVLVGRVFNYALLATTAWRERARIHPIVLGAAVGGLGGFLAVFLPQVTGGGHDLTQNLLRGDVASRDLAGLLTLLLVAKLCFTVVSYATGVPGGIFAPILTMGALLGSLVGQVCQALFPHLAPDPSRLATIGMAAVLTATVRAPLTGVVLIVEMTGQYHKLYSLLLASFVAYALSEWWNNEPIYDALLRRDLKTGRRAATQEARVLELAVEPGSRLDRGRIDHLHFTEDVLIAMIEREGRMLVPHGSTRLEAGDLMTVVAGPSCDDAELADFLDASRSP